MASENFPDCLYPLVYACCVAPRQERSELAMFPELTQAQRGKRPRGRQPQNRLMFDRDFYHVHTRE